MKTILLTLAISSVLTGCSGFMDAMNRDPVDSEEITVTAVPTSDGGTDTVVATSIATDPTRRLVVFNAYPGKLPSPVSGAEEEPAAGSDPRIPKVFICAEPPPDVAQDVLASSTAALSAVARNTNTAEELQAGATLTRNIQTLITALSTRTELVEIYRTSVSALCWLHMNGGIDDEQAGATFKEITLAAIDGATSVMSQAANRASREIAALTGAPTAADDEEEGGDSGDDNETGN